LDQIYLKPFRTLILLIVFVVVVVEEQVLTLKALHSCSQI